MLNSTTDTEDSTKLIYKHKFLGEVQVTPACLHIQRKHPDSRTMFVEHEGEIKEVTRALVQSFPE